MDVSTQDQNVLNTLKKSGFHSATKLSPTLQGSVWRANCNDQSNETLIFKVTNKILHAQRISIQNGKEYSVEEDILVEQAILKYITDFPDCPHSIVKHKGFFQTENNYFMFMEDGGFGLFTFISKAHKSIKRGLLSINNWHEVTKVILKQMIEAIEFIHSKQIVHGDISLENWTINDVKIVVDKHDNQPFPKFTLKPDSIQIKLCDFGLAQLFSNGKCTSSKFAGKTAYKSPEINQKIMGYDAKKNDIFSLGVVIYMMITGTAPWTRASIEDDRFKCIISGHLVELLRSWNVLNYVDDDLIDLFKSIFKYESERIDLREIKKHPWLNS